MAEVRLSFCDNIIDDILDFFFFVKVQVNGCRPKGEEDKDKYKNDTGENSEKNQN